MPDLAQLAAVAAIVGGTGWLCLGWPVGDAMPWPGALGGRTQVTLTADANGQFWIPGRVNGVSYWFLVDTGAAQVAFGRHDARSLGLDPRHIHFDGSSSTANGVMRAATVRVASLEIGPFAAQDFVVSLGEGEMPHPVVGMSWLQHFHMAIRGGVLTLSE
jgi:clan AA aspartic protease (TIGR02281 family)